MSKQERLIKFLAWADKHGLKLINPGFVPDETGRGWAK